MTNISLETKQNGTLSGEKQVINPIDSLDYFLATFSYFLTSNCP